jgi:signal peptidase II
MDQHPDEPGQTIEGRPGIYKDLLLFQLAALTFLLDQFTKFLVREFLALQESFPEEGFFRITHTFNTGSAFGLFQDQNSPLILASVAGIIILALIYRGQRRPTNLLRLSLGLQLGGAVGNLLDRLRMGHVTDFADVGAWPIFNVADASIIIGLLMLAWMFMAPGTLKQQGSGSQRGLEDVSTPPPPNAMECNSQYGPPFFNEEGDDRGEYASAPADSQEKTVDCPPSIEDEEFSGRQSIPPLGE